MKILKNIATTLFCTLLLCGLTELVFLITTADQHYKIKLRNTILYFNHGNEAIPVMADLPWPDNSLIARIDDKEIQEQIYSLGKKKIANAHQSPRTGLLYPQHVVENSIFIVGGSAAFGYPYHSNYSVANLLESELDGQYNIVNVAQVGWSSGQIAPVIERVVRYYDPKAVIIYTGNNEWVQWWHDGERLYTQGFVELYKLFSYSYALSYFAYKHIMSISQNVNVSQEKYKGFQPHYELKGFNYALTHSRQDFDSIDYEQWSVTKNNFLQTFENNLKHMIELCQENDVEVYLCSVPFNFKLSPAWKHPQPVYTSSKNAQLVHQMMNDCITRMNENQWDEALTLMDSITALEPKSPVARYIKGVIFEQQDKMMEAEQEYALCREYMIGNLGSRLSINHTISQVADRMNVPHIDLQNIFVDSEHQEGKYFNETLISDDCHPNLKGNQLIARTLAKYLQ